ncbi:tigger transposable element-derived protein 6-like [Galendromus occidentalis]|uniref:Tigger transposable element-derived protein 6-like n=1 Tax=Galendromus occidentalis TaxID=34638 RepID=A0AAJ6QN00_9ACAR|nr:tigger transposable element-derived protein 6-like [Galendromus occidentalis]
MSRKTLSSLEKVSVLDFLKSNTIDSAVKEFGIGKSTIFKIKKDECNLRLESLENKNANRKRKRTSPMEEVSEALFMWFVEMRAKGAPISGVILKEKAEEIATELGHYSFSATNGWVHRFKKRHNIRYFKVNGERAAADHESANEWMDHVYPAIIEGYAPDQIYNADESGLFFKATPSGTLAVSGSDPTGGKSKKDRLTVLFVSNCDGTDKMIFVIGKFKNPRCFSRGPAPIPYYSSTNAWMTIWIWSDILRKWDRELGSRKILLFADNATCHKLEASVTLKNIRLIFMPPNTTSLIQPMDQGIIRATKAHYRSQVMRLFLRDLESGRAIEECAKSIDVLKALHLLRQAWSQISRETIQNCFKKAGFVSRGQNNDGSDDGVEEDFVLPVPLGLTLKEEEFEPSVTAREALGALSVLRRYMEENFDSCEKLFAIENMVESKIITKKFQVKMTDFFSSKIPSIV